MMEDLKAIFTKEYIAKLERLSIGLTERLGAVGYSGGRKSSAKGSSLEFSDFREYIPGDDLRRVDWNGYGRFDKLYLKLFLEEKRIIEEVAEEGKCVIVGRASGYILREKADSLRVFIHSDNEKRKKRAIEREGIKESEAENALKKNDKRRSGFYSAVTNWEWGNPKFYELYMDSGKLGIDLCVKLLVEAVKG